MTTIAQVLRRAAERGPWRIRKNYVGRLWIRNQRGECPVVAAARGRYYTGKDEYAAGAVIGLTRNQVDAIMMAADYHSSTLPKPSYRRLRREMLAAVGLKERM